MNHNQYGIKKLPKTIPKTNHDYRKASHLKNNKKDMIEDKKEDKTK